MIMVCCHICILRTTVFQHNFLHRKCTFKYEKPREIITTSNQMVKFAYFYHFKNKRTNQTRYLTSMPNRIYVVIYASCVESGMEMMYVITPRRTMSVAFSQSECTSCHQQEHAGNNSSPTKSSS